MSNLNLFEAHKQWRERPADERFWTLRELHETTLARREASVASRVSVRDLKFDSIGENVTIVGQHNASVPSNWAFNQLCKLVDVPAAHYAEMPAQLVAQNLNWAVSRAPRDTMSMLWANGQTPGITRCFTTTYYHRLWDSDIIGWLRRMTQDETNGWKRPRAHTDDQYPSGIYGGDRNIFVFLVNDENRIDDGSDGGLGRGFFCWNSEVYGLSFGFKAFLYRYVCGNHIVWGAEELFDLRMIHAGNTMSNRAEREFNRVINAYLDAPASEEQKVIDAARVKVIGSTTNDAVKFLIDSPAHFTRSDANSIVNHAETLGTDPTNLYNLVNAATNLSQNKKHADARNDMDRKAGRLLEVVF